MSTSQNSSNITDVPPAAFVTAYKSQYDEARSLVPGFGPKALEDWEVPEYAYHAWKDPTIRASVQSKMTAASTTATSNNKTQSGAGSTNQ